MNYALAGEDSPLARNVISSTSCRSGNESDEVPCHFIPLNAAGDTVESLEGNQEKLEEALKEWMRRRIAEIEAERNLERSV